MRKIKPFGRIFLIILCVLLAAPQLAILEAGLSPTTGLETDRPYRPVLVTIGNTEDAREPWGLSKADIVYETIYWSAGHTRYFAVFNDMHPEMVGGMRGARVYHMELRQGWDAPIAHRGGQQEVGTDIYEYMKRKFVPRTFTFDSTRGGNISLIARNNDERVSPHNAVMNIALIASDEYWPKDEAGKPHEPKLPELVFSQEPTEGQEAAWQVEVSNFFTLESGAHFDYNPTYVYNEDTRQYERRYNGVRQVDALDGTPIDVANVIIQYCELSYYEDIESRPVMQTTGEGEMHAYIAGTRITGTWQRETDEDPVRFLDAEGNPLVMLPGKTFIQVIPPEFVMTQDGGWFNYIRGAEIGQ